MVAKVIPLADHRRLADALAYDVTTRLARLRSLFVIAQHISGNLRSRFTDFLTTDGEKPDRNRDAEFEIQPEDSRERLLDLWEQGWSVLFASLGSLAETDMTRSIKIRGEALTVLQAVNRQLTHYSYHVGQMAFIRKGLGYPALAG